MLYLPRGLDYVCKYMYMYLLFVSMYQIRGSVLVNTKPALTMFEQSNHSSHNLDNNYYYNDFFQNKSEFSFSKEKNTKTRKLPRIQNSLVLGYL